jgi:predicted  nucleic acid-binding Zn-ribbon protein
MTDEDPNPASESQLLRCVACGHVFAAQEQAEELVPASGEPGARCTGCGGDEFEQVVLDLGGDRGD